MKLQQAWLSVGPLLVALATTGAAGAQQAPSAPTASAAAAANAAPPTATGTAALPATTSTTQVTTTPPGAKPPPEKPAAAPPAVDGGTYAVRLRDLEARVDELKEQIRRSHTRLSLLSDTILSGGIGGARAEIVFKNDLSGAFRLTRALFVLDGAVQYNKQDDTGALAAQDEIPIFKGSISPGDHTLQVLLKLRGHGYGVFSYLRGYQFDVKESISFSVTEGKQLDLQVFAWEKGGVTTPLEQRPDIRYQQKLRDASSVPGAAPFGNASDDVPSTDGIPAGGGK